MFFSCSPGAATEKQESLFGYLVAMIHNIFTLNSYSIATYAALSVEGKLEANPNPAQGERVPVARSNRNY